jgi:hypothetical protein
LTLAANRGLRAIRFDNRDTGRSTILRGWPVPTAGQLGVAQEPIGLAGPLLVNGEHARGGFYVAMATAEGTLMTGHNRRAVCWMRRVA